VNPRRNPARDAVAPFAGAAIFLCSLIAQNAHADGECRFAPQRPVTLKTMGPCEFDLDRMSFAGDAAQQAACLTTKVLKFGQLGTRTELPVGFAKRVGQSLDLPARDAVLGLLQDFGLDQTFGATLSEPVASARDNDPLAPFVQYFVMHDTSSPNYTRREFPPDIDHDPAINDLRRYMCSNKIEVAHVFINRGGEVFFAHDFGVPWRATKFEMATNFASALKGLFVHVELIQPRRSESSHGWLNDFQAPTPGFSAAQYERLAFVYIVASVRAGRWLIPAFHAVIDEGIYDKHDDPQNFEFSVFDENLEKLLERLRNPPSKQQVDRFSQEDLENCKLIFDQTQDGFPFRWWPAAGALAILLGYLIFRGYRSAMPLSVQRWQLPAFGLLGFCVSVLVFTVYLPMKAFLKYHHALMLLDQGDAKEIRGTIVNFQPHASPGKGHPKESFSVCGVTFAYDPNAIEPGYRETRNQGSPINNGVSVQITYVDDMILRLKICEKQMIPSECGK
jgi:hypothetical protein